MVTPAPLIDCGPVDESGQSLTHPEGQDIIELIMFPHHTSSRTSTAGTVTLMYHRKARPASSTTGQKSRHWRRTRTPAKTLYALVEATTVSLDSSFCIPAVDPAAGIVASIFLSLFINSLTNSSVTFAFFSWKLLTTFCSTVMHFFLSSPVSNAPDR
ncbi:hypothetical protein PHBOTO_004052 [Pseudozyma hubeiensis]|nr:hypothetical protein PHBOTO_004052 [Pseudozyma hubeiensis]